MPVEILSQSKQIQSEMFHLHNRWCLAWASLWAETPTREELVSEFLSEVVLP